MSVNGIYKVDMGSRNKFQKRKLREFLREARERAGVRQVDLAKILGRPQSFVSKYESGERTLDFLEVKAICEALGISFQQFVKSFEKTQR